MLSMRAVLENVAGQGVRDSVIGSDDALDRLIAAVVEISHLDDLDSLQPGCLIVIPPTLARSRDVTLELALRRAAAVRAVGMVVDAEDGGLPASARRLAESFDLALWLEPALQPESVRARLDQLVQNPELMGVRAVRVVSEVMLYPARELGELVERLARVVAFPVALIGANGHPIAGPVLAEPARLAAGLPREGARSGNPELVLDADEGGRESVLLVAAFPLSVDQPAMWLGCRAPEGIDGPSGWIRTALRIASLAFSAHLVQASLAHERENAEAGQLLDGLLRKGDNVGLADVESAAARGWQLYGWHTAVQIRARSAVSELPLPTVARALAPALEAAGVRSRPLDTGDAIVFWVTTTTAPGPDQRSDLAQQVQAALVEVERGYPGLRLRAGIGEAHEGAGGIGVSLGEAQHAVAFAESGQGRTVVQRSDSMTANHLVRTWLPEGAAREVVAALIAPLREADPSGQLVSTLRTYLDCESNVSATAALLHVHRNTAIQRLQRVRTLLPVDIDDPNDRLALRLALRLGP